MIKHIIKNAETSIDGISADMLQPNAVDIKVDEVYRILPSIVTLDCSTKVVAEVEEVKEQESGFFHLCAGSYRIKFAHKVVMGKSEAGYVVPRSTLMRSGIQLVSALYDSGYKGSMWGLLVIPTGLVFQFKRGERLGQFIVFEAESIKDYDGSYQGK